MDARVVDGGGFDVIGVSVRTSNRDEMAGAGKIPKLWHEFSNSGILDRIPDKADDNIIVLYYDYASDKDGEYTYLIGARVTSTANLPTGMSAHHVPPGKFALFTTDEGPAAQVIPKAWQKIWAIPKSQPGGDRIYKTDYEVYGERAHDPQDSQVDIYVGIK
ncbi:MAG TPA: GyrI-like domain-containing protein [Blastocatellia bacterium]